MRGFNRPLKRPRDGSDDFDGISYVLLEILALFCYEFDFSNINFIKFVSYMLIMWFFNFNKLRQK